MVLRRVKSRCRPLPLRRCSRPPIFRSGLSPCGLLLPQLFDQSLVQAPSQSCGDIRLPLRSLLNHLFGYPSQDIRRIEQILHASCRQIHIEMFDSNPLIGVC